MAADYGRKRYGYVNLIVYRLKLRKKSMKPEDGHDMSRYNMITNKRKQERSKKG